MPMLAEGIKEQQKSINDLKAEINELKALVYQKNNSSFQASNPFDYFQIIPNPMDRESKIIYKLKSISSQGIFVISDLQGKTIKKIDLPFKVLDGQLELSKKGLVEGMYLLTLVVNNKEVQSKKFIVL